MDFANVSSFFQNPSFGVDTSGAFNSTANSLSSSPFTSSSSSAGNSGMAFPFLAAASIGTSIAGLLGQQSAAEKQAKAAEDAAREQAQAVKDASKAGAQLQLAEFGLNYLRDRDAFGAGGAGDRFNEALNISQRANIEANNPSLAALRSIARYEDRLSRAMPGYTPPSALFS
jgi:hypothetical protein